MLTGGLSYGINSVGEKARAWREIFSLMRDDGEIKIRSERVWVVRKLELMAMILLTRNRIPSPEECSKLDELSLSFKSDCIRAALRFPAYLSVNTICFDTNRAREIRRLSFRAPCLISSARLPKSS